MLIQHSQPIILHRMSKLEAQSLEAGAALIAKYRGDMMIAEAIERLDAPKTEQSDRPTSHICKTA